MRDAEVFSAKSNPVLQANYALDDDHPLSKYDCLIPEIKRRNHANPYDCFEIDVIANWRRVAYENEELKILLENYKQTQSIIDAYIDLFVDLEDPKMLIMNYNKLKNQVKM